MLIPAFISGYRFDFPATILFGFKFFSSPGFVQTGGITENKTEQQEELRKERWKIPFSNEFVRYL